MNQLVAMRNWKHFMNFQRKLPLFIGLLALVFFATAGKSFAAADYYINDAIVSYPGTEAYPPNISATNFVNNSDFTVNFTLQTFVTSLPLYETWDTLNYTNNGNMVANSGFLFDTQSSSTYLRSRAANFNNSGLVSCGSSNNTSDPFGGALSSFGYDQCVVTATNIVSSGQIDTGVNGLIQLAGQSVELSQSLLNIEGAGANVGGTAAAALNTNFWSPGSSLRGQTNSSAFFPISPFQLRLTNCTSYINFEGQDGTTNIFEAVFIEDDSGSNVATTIYFGNSFPNRGGVDNLTATIQWAGSYLDPANNIIITNYLYLNDDYILGASTNVLPISVPPVNFTFTESTTPEDFTGLPPATPGFFAIFSPTNTVTNYYAFGNMNLLASPDTNNLPNHSITNLPGRVQIYADNYLNLSNAQVTGENYMSLVSTNDFAGSGGAFIQTPYSDLNLGKTNGYLYITNTMEATLPFWGGNVKAWTTAWYDSGTSNLYRILIVGSHVVPVISSQVQNLTLRNYGSNNVIISDTFNVMNSFYSDAQSLTLTTNPPGYGATSIDGELNLEPVSIFWQSSVPNLRYLTNNGAIRMQNLMLFGFPNLTNFGSSNIVITVTNIVSGTNVVSSLTNVVYTTNVVSYLYNNALINNGVFMDQGSTIYAGNFESSGIFSNGLGSFKLQSLTSTLTNGVLYAGGDVSMTASNLVTSNLVLQASRSLTLTATNLLTDSWTPGVTNFNVWSVGSSSVGVGINMPIQPTNGSLLGTIITLSAPTNQTVQNSWAGHDYGISAAGYTNNEAVGVLRMDAASSVIPGHNGVLVFNAPGISNALYVDLLVLTNYAQNGNATNNYNFPWLKINTNMMIYFAQATLTNGLSVAEAIDDQSKIGANGGRLRWVSSYAGYFSSTNVYYTNAMGNVYSNSFNTALAQSTEIDSDGDGLLNYLDPTPFFFAPEMNFTASVATNNANSVKIQWATIPNATNFIYYTTSIPFTNWLPFTNFNNWYYGNNVAKTNSSHGNGFHSPQAPSGVNYSAVDNGTQTNVWLFDTVTNVPHYYKVVVWPWQDYMP